jgi:hypothetical protein
MFSITPIIKLVDAINFQIHSEVDEFALEFGLKNEIAGSYIKEKKVAIMRYLIQTGSAGCLQ